MNLINQKLKISTRFSPSSLNINSFDASVLTDLYKLRCLPLSFYKHILLNSKSPVIVNRNKLMRESVSKIKKYKTWSLEEFIQSLSLLQLAANTKRQIKGTLVSTNKAGAQALMCRLRNSRLSLSSNKAISKRKFRFRRQFPNLSKFEFFIPRSQFIKKFSNDSLNLSNHKDYKLIKKNTEINFNILKIKLFKFRYRRVKRLINIVGGLNKS